MSSDLTRFFDIRLTRSQSLELFISRCSFSTVNCVSKDYIIHIDSTFQSREWMLNLACRLISPRSCHRDMISAASRLLRVIMKKDMRGYYARKDAILIGDLALFCRSNIRIPSDLIGDLMLQFKYMMCTRWTQFWCIVKKCEIFHVYIPFGDSLGIMTFLRNEVTECKGDTLPLLEVYTVLLFILISLEDPNSITISKQYLSLFTDPKVIPTWIYFIDRTLFYAIILNRFQTCHMAHRVRLVAQTLVYSFSLSTRNDRTLAKSLPHAMVMKWGGLRPFFNRTKIMGSDENEEDVEFMMGPLVTTDYLNGHDMFELESAWILHLLQDVMVKIRDEGSIGSLPVEGVPVGQGDSVPSTSLLIFAIVLMAQLYPAKLLPTVVQLIAMVDWNGNIIEINDYNYRQFLLFRLISVLLSKCGEHVESRRRSAEKDIDNFCAFHLEVSISFFQIVSHLCNAGVLNFCRNLLENMAPYWRTTRENRIAPRAWSRDSTPTASDITTTGISTGKHIYKFLFFAVINLSYILKENFDKGVAFIQLVSYHHAPQVRRQSKKVIVAMYDGDKQQYRSIRDKYMMYSHIDLLKKKYFSYSSFTHQQLTEMVEIVSAVAVTANERTNLWRGICEEQLNWLLQLSCKVADAVSCSVIELLVLAIRENAGPDTEDVHLADKLISDEDNRSLLKMLLVRYLIGRDENRRWLMHGMLRSTVQLAMRQNQIILVRILWTELWPLSRGLGSHGAQLADLLATYAPRLLSSADLQLVCDAELQTIKDISAKIEKEGHAGSYRQMTGLGLGWKTMLMETSPCLCCFNRKDMTETLKLNSIKQDWVLYLLKVNLFYCPKTVESAVELKTCPELWQRAATINVTGNDTEIILSLAIPVVTASLVIQFSELTESRQNTELHCPRCSSIVQPNPGVCENCGENVFQCVKCRAINYDEKRCIEAMSRLLSEMEQTRAQLQSGRALCESLWLRTRPLPPVELHMESPESADSLVSAVPAINALQPPVHALLLATTHCKATHEELCMQTQQLIAFREELSNYDRSSRTGPLLHQAINQGFYSTSSRCFGCLCSSVLHSLAILQSICDDATCMERLLEDNVIYNHVVRSWLYIYFSYTVELTLSCRLCELVLSGKISGTVLARCLNTFPDSLWQNKLRSLLAVNHFLFIFYLYNLKLWLHVLQHLIAFKCAMTAQDEDTTLATLMIIDRYLEDVSLSFFLLRLTKTHDSWLWCCLFSPWVSVRAAASKIIVAVAQQPGHLGAAMSVILRGLPMASLMPPAMTDHFFRAAHFIIGSGAQIKIRLYAEGVHVWLIKIIYKECKRMHEEEQHESSMDHSFGTLLRSYVGFYEIDYFANLFNSFVEFSSFWLIMLLCVYCFTYFKLICFVLKQSQRIYSSSLATSGEQRSEVKRVLWKLCGCITAGILNSEEGCRLKQKILDSGAVDKACLHLVSNHPPLYSATESQEWKTFLLRPSLKLV
uniref:E3_UbLigase_R4 domain-containing protein n=1 Tax=Heterorhabditis bacteriophora TaxID=37862 RepID=A0A1I7WCC3_HETBA